MQVNETTRQSPPPPPQKKLLVFYGSSSRAPYANLMQIIMQINLRLADHGFCWKAALNVGSDCKKLTNGTCKG